MAVQSGRVTKQREPSLPVRLADGFVLECLVDTGFTGALMLPDRVVQELGLPVVAREVFETVNRRVFAASVALGEIQWLGQSRTFRIIVSEGIDALIGAEMLDGSCLVVDYISDTVILTDGSVLAQIYQA